MSFRQNQSQQIAFGDPFLSLTERERKALDRSWAKAFAEDIFPKINEEPFSVLYSDKASRPNTPVNIIIGALLIKEMFGLSDDEIVESLMLDVRFQYALHTTSFEEQPLSDKSLSRFRVRCYDYETTHGEDLYHDCITDLSGEIAKLMKIDGRIRRMDSTMIESNIRRLSRMELIYTCIARLVKYLNKSGIELDHDRFDHYLDPDDYNRFIYHSRDEDVDERMLTLLDDADRLLEICKGGYDDVTEYQLFSRCMSEQTISEDQGRRLRTREDGDMDSDILQNPTDPDATFRAKAGKEHRGYVANMEESVGESGSIVTDYQFEKNNTSDSAMLKEHLEKADVQEDKVTIVTDGAYAGTENSELAAEKNIELVPTDLIGRKPDPINSRFEMNDDGTRVLKCPAGHEPKSCSYDKRSGQCHVSFDRDKCASCPFRDQCHPKIFKRVAKKVISKESVARATYIESRGTDRFRMLARLRNGVETLPSILKNIYNADHMPVRGLQRCRFFFGGKIGALNIRKYIRFLAGTGHYAPNPVLE